MDPNQFHWQAYYNLLQNYQMAHSKENSQNPLFFPFMPPPPPLMNFIQNNQSFSTKNSQTFPSMP